MSGYNLCKAASKAASVSKIMGLRLQSPTPPNCEVHFALWPKLSGDADICPVPASVRLMPDQVVPPHRVLPRSMSRWSGSGMSLAQSVVSCDL